MNIINSFWSGGGGFTPYDFTGADRIYSLRKLDPTFNRAFLLVGRSSDSATANVFFDGASSYDSINLNSYISTSSTTTPDAVTLTSWAGSDDVYVLTWTDQIAFTAGTSIGSATPTASGALTDRPQLMSGGAFITKNGLPCVQFNGADAFYNAAADTNLNSGNDFTIITVASNDSTTAKYPLLHTGRITLNAFTVWMDSSATAEMAYAYGTTTPATTNYSSTNNTTNQRLLFNVMTSSDLSSWYNSTADSETGVTWAGTYTNDEFYIGRGRNAAPLFLDGTIQEIIIYASDQSANRNDMEADINNYYSIY